MEKDIYRSRKRISPSSSLSSDSEDESEFLSEGYQRGSKRARFAHEEKTTSGYAMRSSIYDVNAGDAIDFSKRDPNRSYTIPSEDGRMGDSDKLRKLWMVPENDRTQEIRDEIEDLKKKIDRTAYSPEWIENYLFRLDKLSQDPYYNFCSVVAGLVGSNLRSQIEGASMQKVTTKFLAEVELLKKSIKETSTDIEEKLSKMTRIDNTVQKISSIRNVFLNEHLVTISPYSSGVWTALSRCVAQKGQYKAAFLYSLLNDMVSYKAPEQAILEANSKRRYKSAIEPLIKNYFVDEIQNPGTLKLIEIYVVVSEFIHVVHSEVARSAEEAKKYIRALTGLDDSTSNAILRKSSPRRSNSTLNDSKIEEEIKSEVKLSELYAESKEFIIRNRQINNITLDIVLDRITRNYAILKQSQAEEQVKNSLDYKNIVEALTKVFGYEVLEMNQIKYKRAQDDLIRGVSELLASEASTDMYLSFPEFSKDNIQATIDANKLALMPAIRFDELTLEYGYKKAHLLNGAQSRRVEPYGFTIIPIYVDYEKFIIPILDTRNKVMDFDEEHWRSISMRLLVTPEEFSLLDTKSVGIYNTRCSGVTEPLRVLELLKDSFPESFSSESEKKFQTLGMFLDSECEPFSQFYFPMKNIVSRLLAYDLIYEVFNQMSLKHLGGYQKASEHVKRQVDQIADDVIPVSEQIQKLVNPENSFEWIMRPEISEIIKLDESFSSCIDSAWGFVQMLPGFSGLELIDVLRAADKTPFFMVFARFAATVYRENTVINGTRFSQPIVVSKASFTALSDATEINKWSAVKTRGRIAFIRTEKRF